MEKLLTIDEVSEILHLSKSTLYDYVHRNKIPYVKLFKAVRFRPSAIEKWISRQVVRQRRNRETIADDFIDA